MQDEQRRWTEQSNCKLLAAYPQPLSGLPANFHAAYPRPLSGLSAISFEQNRCDGVAPGSRRMSYVTSRLSRKVGVPTKNKCLVERLIRNIVRLIRELLCGLSATFERLIRKLSCDR